MTPEPKEAAMNASERAGEIYKILDLRMGQIRPAMHKLVVKLIQAAEAEARRDAIIELCEGEDCFVAQKKQEAFAKGQAEAYKRGCWEQLMVSQTYLDEERPKAFMKGYRQAREDALKEVVRVDREEHLLCDGACGCSCVSAIQRAIRSLPDPGGEVKLVCSMPYCELAFEHWHTVYGVCAEPK